MTITSPTALQALVEAGVAYVRDRDLSVIASTTTRRHIRFSEENLLLGSLETGSCLQVNSSSQGRTHRIELTSLDLLALRTAIDSVESNAPAIFSNTQASPPELYTCHAVSEAKQPASHSRYLDLLSESVERLVAAGFSISGHLCDSIETEAIGSPQHGVGCFSNQEVTFSCTLQSRESGRTSKCRLAASSIDELDIAPALAAAAFRCKLGPTLAQVPSEDLPIILESGAVADLMNVMFWNFNLRSAQEGRSGLSLREGGTLIGSRITSPAVHLFSDPNVSHLRCKPWDPQGLPLTRTVWISEGVLRALCCDRMWARKQSLPAIGEPRNLLLKGTNKPLEDLIGGVKHGLLITNLWYLRLIQSESMLFTGVTRDGVFLIQDGKAVQPVRDFRFNISALQILSNITDLSCSARTFCYEPGLERVDVPALLTKGLKIVGEVST